MRTGLFFPVVVLAIAAFPATASDPLPDPGPFLEKVKETLLTDQLLLSRYTYDEAHVGRSLDKKGRPKKTETSVHEVFPSLDPKLYYRRIISRDGTPIPEDELEKQDRKHAKKVEEYLKRRGRGGKKQQRLEERRRKQEAEDRKWVDEAFRLFAFDMTAREEIDGRSAIVFRLRPRDDYRSAIKSVRRLKKMHGRMWIAEDDFQMVRLELELTGTISVGGGLVARLHKGTHFEFLREKVNDEIWLPSETRVLGSARLFMVKRLGFDDVRTYSNYKKYSAETSWTSDSPGDP